MDHRGMKAAAQGRLGEAREEKKIALIFGGITVGASLLVTVVNYCLGLEIDKTGGLSNFGIRSVLSAVQTVLPIVQMCLLLCLELGYTAAMLRISRGQYTSPHTLRAGLQRFGPLLRSLLLQSLIYMGVGMLSSYLAMQVYLLTPLSKGFLEAAEPLLTSGDIETAILMADEATQLDLLKSLVPMYGIMLVIFGILAIPISYQYRMVNFVLLDKPGMGAVRAMRESKAMMRRNRLTLFRLDLSFWWYHGLTVLVSAVCYGDAILALLGVELPWSGDVSYFLFYGLYLIATLAMIYFLRNRVDVTYALAYEALLPKEKETSGVVLGNIFHM